MKETVALYKSNRYLKECSARIIGIADNEIFLDRTIFFPTGGGQSCDKGTINDVKVVDVYEKNGLIFHKVESSACFQEGETVQLNLNWEHRFKNMQRHCGEHILSGKFFKVCGGVNRGFHMGDNYMTIDIDIPDLPWNLCMEAEYLANRVIWRNEKISYHFFAKKEDAEGFPLRKDLAIEDNITIVSVGDINDPSDSVACCGTHPDFAGEVGIIKIYKTENNKGMTRVYFDAGENAYKMYAKKQLLLSELHRKYSSDDDSLMEKINISDSKNLEIKNQLYSLKQSILNTFAASLYAEQNAAKISPSLHIPFIISEIEGLDSKSLANLSKIISGNLKVLLLIPVKSENTILMFSNGDFDCGTYVKTNASSLNCKGGGNSVSARLMFSESDSLNSFLQYVNPEL